MKLNFKIDGEDALVSVRADGTDWRLEIGGQEVQLQAERDQTGVWTVETHQGRRRLWLARRGNERYIFCEGISHTIVLPDLEHDDDEATITGGPNLMADMPGKVVKVVVELGQEVSAGQTMLILESMKMETEITATCDGVVAAIHVTGGQLIAQGDRLLDLTPSEASS